MQYGDTLIACGIFRNELESVLAPEGGIPVRYLHADAERMLTALEASQVLSQAGPIGRTSLLFGRGCHPDILKIADKYSSRLPSVQNCIQAVVGPEKTKQLEAERTMVVTPAWITAWPDIMAGLGWDEIDVRINLGRYDRILIIDTGVVSVSDETILSFYDLVQVPIEIEPVNLGYFKDLITQLLGDQGDIYV